MIKQHYMKFPNRRVNKKLNKRLYLSQFQRCQKEITGI